MTLNFIWQVTALLKVTKYGLSMEKSDWKKRKAASWGLVLYKVCAAELEVQKWAESWWSCFVRVWCHGLDATRLNFADFAATKVEFLHGGTDRRIFESVFLQHAAVVLSDYSPLLPTGGPKLYFQCHEMALWSRYPCWVLKREKRRSSTYFQFFPRFYFALGQWAAPCNFCPIHNFTYVSERWLARHKAISSQE